MKKQEIAEHARELKENARRNTEYLLPAHTHHQGGPIGDGVGGDPWVLQGGGGGIDTQPWGRASASWTNLAAVGRRELHLYSFMELQTVL